MQRQGLITSAPVEILLACFVVVFLCLCFACVCFGLLCLLAFLLSHLHEYFQNMTGAFEGRMMPNAQALNNSELLARSRDVQLVELAVGHYLRFADQCRPWSGFQST